MDELILPPLGTCKEASLISAAKVHHWKTIGATVGTGGSGAGVGIGGVGDGALAMAEVLVMAVVRSFEGRICVLHTNLRLCRPQQ